MALYTPFSIIVFVSNLGTGVCTFTFSFSLTSYSPFSIISNVPLGITYSSSIGSTVTLDKPS